MFNCNIATYAYDAIVLSNSLLFTLLICSRRWSLRLSLNQTLQTFLIRGRRWFISFNTEKDQTDAF